MSEIKLTSAQLDKIKLDMNEKVEMLSDSEINVYPSSNSRTGQCNFPIGSLLVSSSIF